MRKRIRIKFQTRINIYNFSARLLLDSLHWHFVLFSRAHQVQLTSTVYHVASFHLLSCCIAISWSLSLKNSLNLSRKILILITCSLSSLNVRKNFLLFVEEREALMSIKWLTENTFYEAKWEDNDNFLQFFFSSVQTLHDTSEQQASKTKQVDINDTNLMLSKRWKWWQYGVCVGCPSKSISGERERWDSKKIKTKVEVNSTTSGRSTECDDVFVHNTSLNVGYFFFRKDVKKRPHVLLQCEHK